MACSTAEEGERAGWVVPEEVELIPLAARVLLGQDLGNEINLRTRPFEDPEPANSVRRFGAYGLITDPAGRLLLSLIAPDYPGAGLWHLPGGGTDFGEQPDDGLVREVFEESGPAGRGRRAARCHVLPQPGRDGPGGRTPGLVLGARDLPRRVTSPTVPQRHGGTRAGPPSMPAGSLPPRSQTLPITDLTRRALAHM